MTYDSTGALVLVTASNAVGPFTFQNGFQFDALGRLVVGG